MIRYNDLYRELDHHNIRDSHVRFILINEKDAAQAVPANYYDKIRLYQDNSKDRIIKKLQKKGPTINNFVFGRLEIVLNKLKVFYYIFRCGYLIFSQDGSKANLENGKNYQELLRILTTAVKNKRRCQALCS